MHNNNAVQDTVAVSIVLRPVSPCIVHLSQCFIRAPGKESRQPIHIVRVVFFIVWCDYPILNMRFNTVLPQGLQFHEVVDTPRRGPILVLFIRVEEKLVIALWRHGTTSMITEFHQDHNRFRRPEIEGIRCRPANVFRLILAKNRVI